MKLSLTAIITGLLFFSNVTGQIIKTKLDIVGGVSAREYVHGGFRYQYSDFGQAGLYYGGDMGLDKSIITTYAADNMLHFGKGNYYSGRPVWYARQGLTLIKSIEIDRKEFRTNFDLSLGREFPVSDWLGFNIDMGVLCQFREKHKLNNGGEYFYNDNWYWMPLIRAQVFISL